MSAETVKKVTYDKLVFLERLDNLRDDATTVEIRQVISNTETKWRADAERLAAEKKKDTDSSGSGYHKLCPFLKSCPLLNRNEMLDEMKSRIKKTVTEPNIKTTVSESGVPKAVYNGSTSSSPSTTDLLTEALIIRFSIDLKDQGLILTHQFHSLPVHLQEMLLCNLCFWKADAVRIQMYANLVENHNLSFFIVLNSRLMHC